MVYILRRKKNKADKIWISQWLNLGQILLGEPQTDEDVLAYPFNPNRSMPNQRWNQIKHFSDWYTVEILLCSVPADYVYNYIGV